MFFFVCLQCLQAQCGHTVNTHLHERSFKISSQASDGDASWVGWVQTDLGILRRLDGMLVCVENLNLAGLWAGELPHHHMFAEILYVTLQLDCRVLSSDDVFLNNKVMRKCHSKVDKCLLFTQSLTPLLRNSGILVSATSLGSPVAAIKQKTISK